MTAFVILATGLAVILVAAGYWLREIEARREDNIQDFTREWEVLRGIFGGIPIDFGLEIGQDCVQATTITIKNPRRPKE